MSLEGNNEQRLASRLRWLSIVCAVTMSGCTSDIASRTYYDGKPGQATGSVYRDDEIAVVGPVGSLDECVALIRALRSAETSDKLAFKPNKFFELAPPKIQSEERQKNADGRLGSCTATEGITDVYADRTEFVQEFTRRRPLNY